MLSIALHGAAFYSKSRYTPPKPSLEQGRTVVHLTLMPSISSRAAALKSPIEKPIEQPLEIPMPIPIETATKPATSAETASVDALEQDASLVEEKGVITPVQSSKSVNPTYPRISRRRGEEGTTILAIEVLANGKTGHISVIQHSGYSRLDEAALKAARKTPFTPAMRFGRNVDSETELSFTFKLTDD